MNIEETTDFIQDNCPNLAELLDGLENYGVELKENSPEDYDKLKNSFEFLLDNSTIFPNEIIQLCIRMGAVSAAQVSNIEFSKFEEEIRELYYRLFRTDPTTKIHLIGKDILDRVNDQTN